MELGTPRGLHPEVPVRFQSEGTCGQTVELSEAGVVARGAGHGGPHCLAALGGPEGLGKTTGEESFTVLKLFSRQSQEARFMHSPIFQTVV